MVAVSIVVHMGALGLAVSRPAPSYEAPPLVIAVELVADPAKPKSAARPAPPKPKPRTPVKTVLPAKPSEPKPKPEVKPDPKPVAKPRREEVFPDPAPKEEKSLDDLLADFREEQGEPTPTPAAPQTAVAPSPGVPGGSGRVPPEVADWMRRVKIHVRRSWVVQPGFRTESLATHVIVKLDAAGNVVGTPEKRRASGNPWYDDSVINGILKASPLPAPPEPGEWDFIFTPEDSY